MRIFHSYLLLLPLICFSFSSPLQPGRRDVVDNVCTEMPDCHIECLPEVRPQKEIVLNDCHVIFDTLLFISQASSPTNTVMGGNNITMTYNTCKSFFSNTGVETIEYCRLTWASKLQTMTSKCRSRGAKCAVSGEIWVLEYEHS